MATDKIKIILNPHGGRWNEQTKITKITQSLDKTGVDYNLELTKRRGHGIELARQASQECYPVIVAAGGDGMINEVINGLIQANGEGEAGLLGIIPIGTANDLATMLGLPAKVEVACQHIAARKNRLIDVGQVNGRYFANNSAIGLEADITIAHDNMRLVNGSLRYLLAATKSIFNASQWQMKLSWDGGGEYDGLITLVSIGNSPRTGGLFYMNPHALLDDGLLDFSFGREMSRWQMLKLLPKTLKGTHIHHQLISYGQTTSLTITSSPGTAVQADGEIFNTAATEINYRLIPNKLRVIV